MVVVVKNMKRSIRYLIPLFVVGSLVWIATQRADFSLDGILPPMIHEGMQEEPGEVISILQQPYRFLGEGRQSFVFESEDKKTVLKFFNRKYFHVPWYSFIRPNELIKRKKRESFYIYSYSLAQKYLQKEAGLIYLHLGETKNLPNVRVIDKANRVFSIPLNQVPFVLQRKGDPFYSTLERVQKNFGDQALLSSLDSFLEIIAYRISQGISDDDHDIEHNFGFLDGKPFHLDPGRLYLSDFSEEHNLEHEWWSATHALRKWLLQKHPEIVPLFDKKQKEKALGKIDN